MSVEEDVISASQRCNGAYYPIPKFWHLYSFNTENIKEYSKYFDLKDKSLLTVGSSGEQVINAHLCGAKAITVFDLCPFGKYYTWLKIAAIVTLDYKEYQYFFMEHVGQAIGMGSNIYRYSKRIFEKIAPTLKELDYESFYFWSELYASLLRKTSTLQALFIDEEHRAKVIRGYSLYLNSEEEFLKAKKAIRDVTFKYVHGNIFEDKVDGQYDNIWLSNLSTYYKVQELLGLVKKLDNNLKPGGKMQFAYLYETEFNIDDEEETNLIYNMPYVKEVFKDYLSEHYQIRTAKEIYWGDKRDREDLVLVYKK